MVMVCRHGMSSWASDQHPRSLRQDLRDVDGLASKNPPKIRESRRKHGIPSGYVNSLLLNMVIEIVDLPTEHGDFP